MSSSRPAVSSGLRALIGLALARLMLHAFTNAAYGFHRDELATLDDARRLAWGYVAYPPVAPFLARVALELFGASLVGLRLFASLAMCMAMILAGLMARELGGTRRAQTLAALASASAPISMIQGALFQYVSFDYLWWVVIAYLVLRLARSEDPRWWLPIGAAIGAGMMTKYTMIFLVAGVVGGVLLTPLRRHLRSPWLWGGASLSLLIVAPNLAWQARHGFISLEFLSDIHARDVAIGRTKGYLVEQLFVASNVFAVPLWAAGLVFFFGKAGARFRILGWMYLIPFLLFLVAQGRSYYMGPAYPMLIAAGSVAWDRWLEGHAPGRARLVRRATWGALLAGYLVFLPVMLPVARINSRLWKITAGIHDNFAEEIGWTDLAETVARIYLELPAEDRARTGILTGNYGEAGAINLYGPALGLPGAISGINSYWLRGYPDPAPEILIVLGFSRRSADRLFVACEAVGRITNRHGVENEETQFHPEILLCREPRRPWPELWRDLRSFG